jgi:hypothetical protein
MFFPPYLPMPHRYALNVFSLLVIGEECTAYNRDYDDECKCTANEAASHFAQQEHA